MSVQNNSAAYGHTHDFCVESDIQYILDLVMHEAAMAFVRKYENIYVQSRRNDNVLT